VGEKNTGKESAAGEQSLDEEGCSDDVVDAVVADVAPAAAVGDWRLELRGAVPAAPAVVTPDGAFIIVEGRASPSKNTLLPGEEGESVPSPLRPPPPPPPPTPIMAPLILGSRECELRRRSRLERC
jgi:hypothetical protein